MAYFPALLKLDGQKILVVGGGRIAGEKIGKLIDFTHDITVIAPEFSAETAKLVETHGLYRQVRPYREGDIAGFGMVIVAVDDLALQKTVYEACRKAGILCNSVDSVDYCDFIFPSYIKKGPLVIAFSTSGISPSLAKYLRRAIEGLIPDDITEFLARMKQLRTTLPKGKERMRLLDDKARDYVQNIFKKKG